MGHGFYFRSFASLEMELIVSLHWKPKSWHYYLFTKKLLNWTLQVYVGLNFMFSAKAIGVINHHTHFLFKIFFSCVETTVRIFSSMAGKPYIFMQGATNTEKAKIGLSRWFLVTLWTPSWVKHPSGQRKKKKKKWVCWRDAERGSISSEPHFCLTFSTVRAILAICGAF